MRFLALDYGRKRVGLALSDPLGMIAQPVGYLVQDQQTVDAVRALVEKHKVETLVLGYPRSLDGSPGPMAKEVEDFSLQLRGKFQIPIVFWDEQFTTAQAQRLLIESGVRRAKRKKVKDTVCAALILQGYLEFHSKEPG